MKRVLVTGASGFIGRQLCATLRTFDHQVVGLARSVAEARRSGGVTLERIEDIARVTDWARLVSGFDVVIHLAARAHRVGRSEARQIEEFRRVNVTPTLRLFRACSGVGVRRFVLISSIGVHGIRSEGQPISETDRVNPQEPYARSKWEAEGGIRALAASSRSEIVIVRPALVYGPGAKGNFYRLMQLVSSGYPLPFAGIKARRNYLGLQNLCMLLERCAFDARAAGQTFVAADPWSVELPTLLELLARPMGRKIRLWRVAPTILTAIGTLTGRAAEVSRLTSSLEVDSAKAMSLLDWSPKVSLESEVGNMVACFMNDQVRGND